MDRFVGSDATTGSAAAGHSSGVDFRSLSGPLSGHADSFGLAGEKTVDLAAGSDFGGFVIVRLLGEGGMGRVYEARQQTPERLVAVKVLRDGLASHTMMRRFEQEAGLLARLRHPHVAQVHTAGTWRHGDGSVPFFVMELVEEALPIDRFARERVLSVRQRVVLLRYVAGAVAYGHRMGIVHRDLKPGNILVGADGEPKVIDFGVARTTDADLAVTTLQTDVGQLVGTLRYMSPEQFDADASRIDGRSDVYALGLVLHELLVGDLPYDLRGLSIVAAARIIREHVPQVVATVSRALAISPEVRAVDARQLAAITEKCLQKHPADRYATADDLESDLTRWLAGEPVRARSATVTERVVRLLRRHPLSVAVVVAMVLVGVAAAFYSERAWHQEQIAERHRVGEQTELYYALVQRAAAAADRRNIPIAASLLERARTVDVVHGHPIEIDCLAARLDESLTTLQGHDAIVRVVAAAPAGDRLATGDDQGVVCVWATGTEGMYREAHRLRGHGAPIWSAAFAPDGRRLVTAAADGIAIVWDAASGRMIGRLQGHTAAIYGVAFAPDGGFIATASGDGSVGLWDAEQGGRRAIFMPPWQSSSRDRNIYGVAFTSGGDRLAAACGDGVVRLWDVGTGKLLRDLRGHSRRVLGVAFSPDDRRLASAAEDGTARLWHLEDDAAALVLRHPLRVNGVAWTADGSSLATVSADAILRIWNSTSGSMEREHVGHRDAVWSVACLQDDRFVTASADTTARIWGSGAGNEPIMECGREAGLGVRGVACSPDGRLVATATAQGRVTVWNRATCVVEREMPAIRGRVNAVEFSPSGDLVNAACSDGVVRVYAVADATEVYRIETHAGPAFAATFSPDGQRIAIAAAESSDAGTQLGAVQIHAAQSESERLLNLPHPGRVHGVVWSRDGRRLASACADGLLRDWDAATGELLGAFQGHRDDVNWVASSRDGNRVATASSDGTVRLWSPSDGWSTIELSGPVGQIWEVAFSPDGTRIAAGGADGGLHVWQAESGRHLLALDAHEGPIWGVVFTPDGESIVTGGDDGTVRVWGVSAAELHRRRAGSLPDR